MVGESEKIRGLFQQLLAQPKYRFPKARKHLDAPTERGVYIIRKGETVQHVGSTPLAQDGISQRLSDHLYGRSSFIQGDLHQGIGSTLREDEYTYQCLCVPNSRDRTLLEALAIGTLCPEHVGKGRDEEEQSPMQR